MYLYIFSLVSNGVFFYWETLTARRSLPVQMRYVRLTTEGRVGDDEAGVRDERRLFAFHADAPEDSRKFLCVLCTVLLIRAWFVLFIF